MAEREPYKGKLPEGETPALQQPMKDEAAEANDLEADKDGEEDKPEKKSKGKKAD